MSWLASSVADSLVKSPVICDSELSTSWISGAETTSLSRTTATRQLPPGPIDCGQVCCCCCTAAVVSLVHSSVPLPLKLRLTTHRVPAWVSRTGAADETS